MDTQRIVIPQYRRIAIDIARNIANGEYMQGDRLFGRSVLASRYKVSSETIRKAVFLLKDVGIVRTEKGSGIEVVSKKKAEAFLQHNDRIGDLSTIQNEIAAWAREQAEQAAQVSHKIQYVIDEMERINAATTLKPFQIGIEASCQVIGKTVDELHFWHITGGTIVAIRRDNRLIVSPGPYATFCEGDIFYIIGDDAVYSAVMKLFYE